MIDFLQNGKIVWDKVTKDRTLRFTGDYRFIDEDTIRIDFVRYSNKSAVWDIDCYRSSTLVDIITIRDCNADYLVASMKRIN